jgi:hypothetical protein
VSGFIRLPRSLRNNSQWVEFTSKERHVFEEIYHRAAFSIVELDDHGKMIVVHPGQLMTTFRQLAGWCNDSRPSDWCDEKQPEKIIEFDKDFVRRLIHKLERCKIVRQEVRHVKTILTIMYEGFIQNGATGSATRVRQDCDKIATQTKKDKKDKKEKEVKTDNGLRPVVNVCPIKKTEEEMEEEEKLIFRTVKYPGAAFITYRDLNEALLKEMFSQEQIDEAISTFKIQNPKIGSSDPTSYIKSIIENQTREAKNASYKPRNKKNSVSRELPDFTESVTHWGYLRP